MLLLLRGKTLRRWQLVRQEIDFRLIRFLRPLNEEITRQERDERFSNPRRHLSEVMPIE